jgi:hypothetical protein
MRMALAAIAAFALAGVPAFAQTVETRISEDFQKKLEKDYGVREASVLQDVLKARVEKALNKSGASGKVSRVVVTIEDARPNRPTFQQVTDKPGLDPIRSISIGGADVTGVAFDASGAQVAELAYDWYETDLSQAIGVDTWHDARWVFSRFATRFADKIG